MITCIAINRRICGVIRKSTIVHLTARILDVSLHPLCYSFSTNREEFRNALPGNNQL